MKTTEQLRKPVKEANYLNVENTDRYRPILRLFYTKYEKMKYWLYQEEIFEELQQDPYFANYTEELCQQDLNVLASWGNLIAIQDTKNVRTLEEFKNRKFQYQLSEYSVEIERMVIRLENLFVEGASLEPTLLERIRNKLAQMEELHDADMNKVYGWWQDLENDFARLNQNYQDYIRALNSAKADELMKTREFLVFKDHLMEYLRTFVKALQYNVSVIEKYIQNAEPVQIEKLLSKVVEYEMQIPRIDVEVNRDALWDKMQGRWNSLDEWFVGKGKRVAEATKVFDATNDIIRKITRYATRISEMNNMGANRKEEYYKVAKLFLNCIDLNEAHRLSANVFGVEKTWHIKGDMKRETDSINSSLYDEPPHVIAITPKNRSYRERAQRRGIIDHSARQDELRQEMMDKYKREREIINSYIVDDKLDFASLPVIEPEIRDVFLLWLSKALERKDETSRTDDGRTYHLGGDRTKTCIVKCTDGEFTMPAFTINFEKKDDNN